MSTVKVPPPTVRYTPINGDSVMASIGDASKHVLSWRRANGAVFRDGETRVLAWLTTEHAFHVFAADHFGADRDADHTTTHLSCGSRGIGSVNCDAWGAGWQAACSCGHFRTGWCPSEFEAARRIGAHLMAAGVVAIPAQRSHL